MLLIRPAAGIAFYSRSFTFSVGSAFSLLVFLLVSSDVDVLSI